MLLKNKYIMTNFFLVFERIRCKDNQRRQYIRIYEIKTIYQYAKSKVKPLLTEQAAQMIQNLYVDDRQKSQFTHHSKSGGKSCIPNAVRLLELVNDLRIFLVYWFREFGLDLSNELLSLEEQANRLIQKLSERFHNQRIVEFTINNLIQTEQLQQVEMKKIIRKN